MRKVLETKLNSGNVFKGINTWAVSGEIFYCSISRVFLKTSTGGVWHENKKVANGFHPKSNVDQLYLSRSEGGRGFTPVHDTVETAFLGLRIYVRNSKERLLIA